MSHDRVARLRYTTLLFCLTVVALVAIGAVFVYSASFAFAIVRYGNPNFFINKHLLHIVFGFVALVACSFVSPRFLKAWSKTFCWLSIIATAMMLFSRFGISVHGSRRWISLVGMSLQPGEFVSLSLLLFASSFLSRVGLEKPFYSREAVILLCSVVGALVLFLFQPDFGAAATLFGTLFLLFSTMLLSWRQIAVGSMVAFLFSLLLIAVAPYRVRRISIFLNPWCDPQGKGFQIIQSLIAIGMGHWWGVGVGQSQQKFFYLPMQHTDFIFSVVAEELGFVGISLLIFLFAVFVYLGLRISLLVSDEFSSYVILSFVTLIGMKAVFHMMVTSALAPTKGIGLPFISYGGSSLLVGFCAIGIILSLVRAETYKSNI